MEVGNGWQVIVLDAAPARQYAPFVFESKPYHKTGMQEVAHSERSGTAEPSSESVWREQNASPAR